MPNKLDDFCKKYSAPVLRYAMSGVILWFAVAQFLDPVSFSAYVPDSAVHMLGVSAIHLVYFNAVFELVFGLLLVLGVAVRLSAFLLALHLLDIAYVVGYGEIGVRDIGLALATLVVAGNGSDIFSLVNKNNN